VCVVKARVNDELVVYEAFPYHPPTKSSSVGDQLRLRFKKVPHGLLVKVRKMTSDAPDSTKPVEVEDRRVRVRWLRPFEDISGYSGVS